jgi:hypothetical protein
MASRSKNKTTFAKLAREGRLRERRMEKAARKEARKRAAEDPSQPGDTDPDENADGELASPNADGELASPVVTSDG